MQTEDLGRYADDVVAFATEQFILPDTGRPIVLAPHQEAILRHCLTPDATGAFPYTTMLYSCPKKSGKSTLSALVGLWAALREPRAEVYVLANDLDQSTGRVFRFMVDAVRANPWLRRAAVVRAKRIEFPATGSFIEALPSDYTGSAGSNPSCTVFDELWG